jgi:hypothetical protein
MTDRYYNARLWWFESSELCRRLAVSCVLFFFEPGRKVQVVFALVVVTAYLIQMTWLKPYRGIMNNEFAVIAQAQLVGTLICALLIKLRVPIVGNEYDVDVESEIMTYLVICTSMAVTAYGLFALFKEGTTFKRRWYEEQARAIKHAALSRASARKSVSLGNKGMRALLNASDGTSVWNWGGFGGFLSSLARSLCVVVCQSLSLTFTLQQRRATKNLRLCMPVSPRI